MLGQSLIILMGHRMIWIHTTISMLFACQKNLSRIGHFWASYCYYTTIYTRFEHKNDIFHVSNDFISILYLQVTVLYRTLPQFSWYFFFFDDLGKKAFTKCHFPKLTKSQIINQVATAILAQANASSNIFLKLLQQVKFDEKNGLC